MFQRYLSVLVVLVTLSIGSFSTLTPVIAQTKGEVPGAALGIKSDSDLWRYVRTGNAGTSQMKNELAGVMIQSEGDNWRAFRNGPLSVYGAFGLAGIIGLLIVFYLVRGRIRIDSGPSDKKIQRFGAIDRFAHWLMAGSFVVLAITGLNLLYGRHLLIPLFGKEAFAAITTIGKFAHNYLAFAFMLGLALSFVLWARHNIPSKLDLKWLAMGGGIF
jgi:formate dehydrogenase subunit gamma